MQAVFPSVRSRDKASTQRLRACLPSSRGRERGPVTLALVVILGYTGLYAGPRAPTSAAEYGCSGDFFVAGQA